MQDTTSPGRGRVKAGQVPREDKKVTFKLKDQKKKIYVWSKPLLFKKKKKSLPKVLKLHGNGFHKVLMICLQGLLSHVFD